MCKDLGVVLQDKQHVGTQRVVQKHAGPPRPAPGDHLRDLDERGRGFGGEEGGLEERFLDLILLLREGRMADDIDNALCQVQTLTGLLFVSE